MFSYGLHKSKFEYFKICFVYLVQQSPFSDLTFQQFNFVSILHTCTLLGRFWGSLQVSPDDWRPSSLLTAAVFSTTSAIHLSSPYKNKRKHLLIRNHLAFKVIWHQKFQGTLQVPETIPVLSFSYRNTVHNWVHNTYLCSELLSEATSFPPVPPPAPVDTRFYSAWV